LRTECAQLERAIHWRKLSFHTYANEFDEGNRKASTRLKHSLQKHNEQKGNYHRAETAALLAQEEVNLTVLQVSFRA
jgi:hypothetical protein